MKATQRLAEHQHEQAIRQAEKLRLQVLLEVDTVFNRVLIDQQRLAATRKSREAARQSADAELKRLQQGVSTSYQVLQLQRNYSQARSRELAALADFNKSLADLYLTTATLLEKQQINIVPPAPPAVAQPSAPLPTPVAVSGAVPTTSPVATGADSKKTVSTPAKANKPSLGERIGKFFRRS